MQNLITRKYEEQVQEWPVNGNYILAQYDDSTILVYQAYNERIAQALCTAKCYHADECAASGFSMSRMTWIKTNFLWMMFRSGWATKPNQDHVVAIRLLRAGFEELLATCKLAQSSAEAYGAGEASAKCTNGNVVLQWDPDHYPNGDRVGNGRRAIQMGIRAKMLKKMSRDFIVDIFDMTEFVREQAARCHLPSKKDKNIDLVQLETPAERVYVPSDVKISRHINLTL